MEEGLRERLPVAGSRHRAAWKALKQDTLTGRTGRPVVNK